MREKPYQRFKNEPVSTVLEFSAIKAIPATEGSVPKTEKRSELRLVDAPLAVLGPDAGEVLRRMKSGISLEDLRARVLEQGRKRLAEQSGKFDLLEADLMKELQGTIASRSPAALVKFFGVFGMTDAMAAEITTRVMTAESGKAVVVTGFVDGNVVLDLGAIKKDRAKLAATIPLS